MVENDEKMDEKVVKNGENGRKSGQNGEIRWKNTENGTRRVVTVGYHGPYRGGTTHYPGTHPPPSTTGHTDTRTPRPTLTVHQAPFGYNNTADNTLISNSGY